MKTTYIQLALLPDKKKQYIVIFAEELVFFLVTKK